MTGHIKVCKRRYKEEGATLPPVSLADDDSCRVDDTVSVITQFQNPDSEEEDSNLVGQIRPPLQSTEQLKHEVESKALVPIMEGVKSLTAADQSFGLITRAFKNRYRQDQDEKVNAFRSCKSQLIEEGAKELRGEINDALKEVADDK